MIFNFFFIRLVKIGSQYFGTDFMQSHLKQYRGTGMVGSGSTFCHYLVIFFGWIASSIPWFLYSTVNAALASVLRHSYGHGRALSYRQYSVCHLVS